MRDLCSLAGQLLDRLLPPICLLCRLVSDADGICTDCRRDLAANAPACPRCAAPVADSTQPCGQCQRRPPPFERLLAPLAYGFPVDLALTRLKFARELAFARPLGEILATALAAANVDVDAIVPVPLHWRRLVWRGFNQAERLARPVARRVDRPLYLRALHRVAATRPQTALDRRERRRNVASAFRAAPAAVAGRRMLLVDDVVTSGATVAAASQALIRAGAVAVTVAAVARA